MTTRAEHIQEGSENENIGMDVVGKQKNMCAYVFCDYARVYRTFLYIKQLCVLRVNVFQSALVVFILFFSRHPSYASMTDRWRGFVNQQRQQKTETLSDECVSEIMSIHNAALRNCSRMSSKVVSVLCFNPISLSTYMTDDRRTFTTNLVFLTPHYDIASELTTVKRHQP